MKIMQLVVTDSPNGSALFALDDAGRIWRSFTALYASEDRVEWVPVRLPFAVSTESRKSA